MKKVGSAGCEFVSVFLNKGGVPRMVNFLCLRGLQG